MLDSLMLACERRAHVARKSGCKKDVGVALLLLDHGFLLMKHTKHCRHSAHTAFGGLCYSQGFSSQYIPAHPSLGMQNADAGSG